MMPADARPPAKGPSIGFMLRLASMVMAGIAIGVVALAGTWFVTSYDKVNAFAWIGLFNLFTVAAFIGLWASRSRYLVAMAMGLAGFWVLAIYLFATDYFYGGLS